jgi:hypothetical protein
LQKFYSFLQKHQNELEQILGTVEFKDTDFPAEMRKILFDIAEKKENVVTKRKSSLSASNPPNQRKTLSEESGGAKPVRQRKSSASDPDAHSPNLQKLRLSISAPPSNAKQGSPQHLYRFT